MTGRSIKTSLVLVMSDLRANRGLRTRHAIAWRLRRLRNRLLPSRTQADDGERVYSTAFGPNGEQVLSILRVQLPATGVQQMRGGTPRTSSELVHVRAEDVGRLCDCLLEHAREIEILVRRSKLRAPLSPATRDHLVAEPSSFDLLIVEDAFDLAVEIAREPVRAGGESVPEQRRHVRCSQLAVAVWGVGDGPADVGFRETDRSLPLVRRLRAGTFDALMERTHDFDTDLPGDGPPAFDIDIVYTWVDGDDPEWRAEMSRYAMEVGRTTPVERVAHEERFRNRDELKYSLRSVELFAPWVRQIHIVTADQCPDWLDVDHPKVNLVSHKDIYADLAWLPTFNSSSIETQLHHVPGLAQRFIYFNDDVFLGQYCEPGDFFHPNGILKYFPSSQRAYDGDIDEQSEEYVQADRNAIELLRRNQPYVGREIMMHVPHPADRDMLFDLENTFPDEFAACAASRFRSSRDLRPIAFLQFHYGNPRRMAMAGSISHRYLALWKPTITDQLANVERRRSYKTFCINDVGLQPERTAQVNEAVVAFLEAYFPKKSSFELSNEADRPTC